MTGTARRRANQGDWSLRPLRAPSRGAVRCRYELERALHDDVAIAMATLTLNLELISGAVDQQQVRAGLDAARDTLCRVLDELRKLGAAIYPPVLASAGLRPALLAVAEHRDLTLRLDLPRHDLSREARTRTGLLLADHLLTLSPGTTVVVRVRGRRLVRVWITEERPGQSHRRRHRAVLRCG